MFTDKIIEIYATSGKIKGLLLALLELSTEDVRPIWKTFNCNNNFF